MSTELTDPVEYTKIVTEQRVDKILMNMKNGDIEYHIGDYENSEATVSLQSKIYYELFSNIPAGPVKDDFIDVLDHIRSMARTRGQLGEGTDIAPF